MSNKNEITETKVEVTAEDKALEVEAKAKEAKAKEAKAKAKKTTKYKSNRKERFCINSIRLVVEGGKTVEIANAIQGRFTKDDKRLIRALELKILSKV